jgi:hypothetical protein
MKEIIEIGLIINLIFQTLRLNGVQHNVVTLLPWSKFSQKKKSREELTTYFPLIQHGPHRKRRVQQFFYCCLCIHCHGNIFTEPLFKKIKGYTKDTQLMGGIQEVRRWDGLRCHDIHNNFHKIYLSIYLSIYFYSCYSHLEHRASVKRLVSLQFLNLR